MKRVFFIVLDSCGAGEAPDAARFGDAGAHTLKSCHQTGNLHIPNLMSMGLGNIDGLSFLGTAEAPTAAFGKLQELSNGKDTTVGHWELCGVVSEHPLPTYPNGFPDEILAPFKEQTGRGVLANATWSGTAVLEQYGAAHMKTGALIVYTSADSVFQIAAHEEIVPPEKLYDYCRIARKILTGKHGVGRVIARPFVGSPEQGFTRTANRHDFSLEPPAETLLDSLQKAGLDSLAVGKIYDIFAGRGITKHWYTQNNADGMAHTTALSQTDFHGLCFTNLVDFDMQYGHRRDAVGYAQALNAFDTWLGTFVGTLGDDDLLIITADHGCDPNFTQTTDHTREFVPLLVYGKTVRPQNLGTLSGFDTVAHTVADLLDLPFGTAKSLKNTLLG